MRTRERIVRDRFSERSCGRCGAPYAPENVLILARRTAHWMVMVSCPHCQQRNVFVVSFSDGHDAPTLDAGALATEADLPLALPPLPSAPATQSQTASPSRSPSASSSSSSSAPISITAADVADMREFLASFSGDFRALFSTPRPRLKDDPPSSA
ncbi:MAG TPA: hypothetical protein VFU88_17830 [Ktedonobacterales bacterium]|nr:hypothetical protein [Ktedonobacterales bacterium]